MARCVYRFYADTRLDSAPQASKETEMGKLFTFLREVWAELKKVTWPTWVEVVGSTVVVILTSLLFAAIIGVWDKVLSELVILLL